MMIKWVKPSGVELETNDLKKTVAYCESLGWKRKGAKPAEEKPKRIRRTKAQMEADKAAGNG
jgi:hypothetical protein